MAGKQPPHLSSFGAHTAEFEPALLSAGLDGFAGWPLACLVAADAGWSGCLVLRWRIAQGSCPESLM